jgi:two-component system, OmpR family, copper resistance phosphate regulon response regulator CusR
MKKILIVEDDQRIAQNIKRGLEEKGYEAEIAFDGRIGLKMALSIEFDLIMLDINMPEMNGYEVCKQIRLKNSQVPIIMLTALGETEDKIEGFEAGADDYLAKPFDFRELFARIQVFMKRSTNEVVAVSDTIKIADLEVNLDTRSVVRAGHSIELTAKEFALLVYLMKNKGKVISKSEISEQVWDVNFETGTNVIEVYINFLRKKIDKEFDTKLIHTKTGMGYVLKDE